MEKMWKKMKSKRAEKTPSSAPRHQPQYREVWLPRGMKGYEGPSPTAPMANMALYATVQRKVKKERESNRSKTGKTAPGDLSSPSSPALEPEEDRRRKMARRSAAIKELVQTEMDFLTDVELCIREVVRPLREKQVVDVDRLFSNMETVCELSAALLHRLEQSTAEPDPEAVLIGGIFVQAKAALEDVYKMYCYRHDDANHSLKSYEKEEEIKEHFITCVLALKDIYGHEGNLLDMRSLLIMPVQRVSKYPLLLGELWQATPDDHPDKRPLQEAFTAVTIINVNIEELKRQRQKDTGDDLHLPDMKMILLGYKGSGKSSLGNTILGSEQFSLETTAQCEKRQGDVAGRNHVTVVDTPGWWSEDALHETPEQIKQEIVHSASLCPPGPHALLLIIAAGFSHTADVYKHIEEHMQLLGPTAWSHTMILFSGGDLLGGQSTEQFIESEGEALQRLVDKCGNRYHVFSNNNRGDDAQVTELLDKIEEMVAGKEGHCGTESPAPDTQSKGKASSVPGDDLHLSEMRMILLGPKGSGKSSLGNTILGSEQFSLETTAQCKKRQGDVAGRHVTLIDTPGWFINATLNTTSELTKEEIVHSPSLCHPGPHALLLVIRAGTSYPADWCKNIEDHMQLLSESVWSNAMILFSFGDFGDYLGGLSIEQFIECEGEALQRLVEKCGNRYHVFNNLKGGDDTQVTELLDKIEEMVAGNDGHCGTGSPATPTPDKRSRQFKTTIYLSLAPLEVSRHMENDPFIHQNTKISNTQSDGAASSVPENEEVEKLMALLEESERELQNTITSIVLVEEECKREQQKLTQLQREHAEKVAAQMKEREDTIKEMEDSKRDLQKRIQGQRDHVEMLAAQMKEEDTIIEMEDSKRDLQKLTQEQRDHVEMFAAQMKEEDTIIEMEDSKRDLQKLTQEQRDHVEMFAAQMKEDDTIKEMEDSLRYLQKRTQEQRDRIERLAAQMKEDDTITEMEDSAREEHKLTQDQKDHAEKLAAQMKEEEDTVTAMGESKRQQQKLTQDQRVHTETLAAQMTEMKRELEKIHQRQMEADEKCASATQQHPTQIVTAGAENKLKYMREVFDLILHELLNELLQTDIITDKEMDTAMAEKYCSFMIDLINQMDRNLSEARRLKLVPTD